MEGIVGVTHRMIRVAARRRLARLARAVAGAGIACSMAAAAAQPAAGGAADRVRPSAPPAAEVSAIEAQSRALERASEAVVGLRARAVDGARSAATLGTERAGSGVVIGPDDLVLTIGYLVLEADTVDLMPDDGRRVPARVVAYDLASGFGLVQALAPLRLQPVPIGQSGAVTRDEPLVFVSGSQPGGAGAVSTAQLLSRRDFAGFWEYHLEGALFVGPGRPDHSGAGLFNGRGELLGVGSLFVRNALGDEAPAVPGNMFVPIDLLAPILAELRERGASAASARAWLGINGVERDGEVRVARVTDDSPADVAGLQAGDRILRIDGVVVDGLAQLWKQLWAGGAPERAVTLEIQRDGVTRSLMVQTVDRAKTLRRAQGI
jgi:S1-C subfamily serine protease